MKILSDWSTHHRSPQVQAFCRNMGKRKVDAGSDTDVEEHSEEEQPKSKKSRPKKAKAPAEPYTDNLGWNIVPPSLLWKWV